MTHLPPRTIERLVADDLPPPERAAAEEHVADCEACAERARAWRGEQGALLAEVPPERFVMRVAARRARARRTAWLVAGPAALAAAAALAVLVRPDPGLRTKGRTLTVAVERAGRAHELGAGERVAAGDKLQLSLAGAGTIGVWIVDAAGRIDRLSDAPIALTAVPTALRQSAIVDSPCVDSAIVVAAGAPTDAELRAPRADMLVRTPALPMKLVLAALLLITGVAAADERIALFVGANLGGSDDEPLHYAEADARRMRALLLEVGDLVGERARLVVPRHASEVLAQLAQLAQRPARISELVVYYSGHGDDAALHIGEEMLRLDDLRRAMAAVPARVRILLVDACRGVRDKGVSRAPALTTTVEPDGPSGRIELRASSVGEAAQESDELGGSIFSHFLASALRGGADADQDGRVTLAELYAYVYRRTLLRTGTSGALQHPTLDAAIAGAGEIVLTRPVRAAAMLEVPAGEERYLVFQLPRGVALGEVGGNAERVLALPAGRFLVVRRAGAQIAVAEIDLGWGGRRAVRSDEFRKMSREELVARGGRVELRRFRIDARTGTELAVGSVESAAGTFAAALAYTRGALEAEVALGYAGGHAAQPELSGTEHAVTGRVAIGFRLVAGRITVNPSIGLDGRWSFQRFAYDDSMRRVAAGLPEMRTRNGGALGPDVTIRLGLALPRHLVLGPLVGVALLLRREQMSVSTATTFHPVIQLGLALGYAF